MSYEKIGKLIEKGEFENKCPYPSDKTLSERALLVPEYRKGQLQAIIKFRKALEEEYGVVGHPKKDLLWSIAWGQGHSCGLTEILIRYDELVKLLS